MASLGNTLGGPAKATAMLKGQGVSLILKSISMDYKAPVTYPDTLLIAHKPYDPTLDPHASKVNSNGALRRASRTHMYVRAAAYSYKQKRIVTESDSVLVWYDYDKLAKCDPGEEMRKVVESRMKLSYTFDKPASS